jgi:prepilin-type N-terminal cleavage/methylation domain-containing protein
MKKINLINNNKGFTLIEMIVSIALISIIAILFATTFSTSLNIMTQATKKTVNVNQTAAGIEKQRAGLTGAANNNNTTSTASSFIINFQNQNGQTTATATVSGNYYTNASSDVTFKSFVPAP